MTGGLQNSLFQFLTLAFEITEESSIAVGSISGSSLCPWGVRQADCGDVLAAGDLRQVPTKSSVHLEEVNKRGAFVNTVQHKKNPVLERAGRQGLPDTYIGLPDCSSLMGVKDDEHEVGDLCQVADHFLVVITAIALSNAIQHSRCVDDGEGLQKRCVDFL